MRWLVTSLILGVLSIAAGAGFYYFQGEELEHFCSTLSPGMTMTTVREAAVQNGFSPKVEPYAQIRIEPAGPQIAAPSCRVFFNRERTVEYRVWQAG